MKRRRVGFFLLVAGLVIGAVIVAGPPTTSVPHDPASTQPDGLRGLVELLRAMDVEVEVGFEVSEFRAEGPTDASTRIFVPDDLLGEERRERLLGWVSDGATMVVAGQGGELHGLAPGSGPLANVFGMTTDQPNCPFERLDAVGDVTHGRWSRFVVPEPDPGEEDPVACFAAAGTGLSAGGQRTAWLVARQHGEGIIVAIGSATPFTNGALGRDDNAVLAAALLGTAPGDRLLIVPRPAAGEGDTPVLELVPAGFFRGLLLLAAAALLAVVWRARRLGPPVPERLPPVLPSAETARSLADLLQRAGARDSAAVRLRADARTTAARALGLPMATSAEQVAELVAARTGVSPDHATRAIVDSSVRDDAELTAVASACADVRDAVRRPAPHPESRP